MEGLGWACTASMKTSELSSSTRQMLVVHMYFCSCTLLVVASLIAMVANSALCYQIYLYVVTCICRYGIFLIMIFIVCTLNVFI